MNNEKLKNAKIGESVQGFELEQVEAVPSIQATLYKLKHIKTQAQLLYFDRNDENKTFAITFKTLPEDHTGVFHILEHSVLGGSKRFPVKEPFVNMLQSSLQTFLNAMTFNDKTVYPVSSRNEQDFINLMSVYLDGVFHPLIELQRSTFMQEGWHYEFEDLESVPYYNGVVYSEMKGAFSSVDTIIREESERLLFPDNCYGYVSGGYPENITDLTYEQFIATHQRFYHPSNSLILLDGRMDVDAVLKKIDSEYLSHYEYQENDFDFKIQLPIAKENMVYYASNKEENALAQLAVSKILCRFDDIEKIYATKILADYLCGSNEAPLKRAFLEKGMGQDVSLMVVDGMLQPYTLCVVRNVNKEKLEDAKSYLTKTVHDILAQGLDRKALLASFERMVFMNREVHEPYGVNLVLKVLDGWLYGGNPLMHIENDAIFKILRQKIEEGYFEELLAEILVAENSSYLYVLPSLTKEEDDTKKETEKIIEIIQTWDEKKKETELQAFFDLVNWQQSMDSAEALSTLPHLNLADIQLEAPTIKTSLRQIGGREVMEIHTHTNGIVYLNLYFDVSDFSLEELRLLSVLSGIFKEMGTLNKSTLELQNEIKAKLGSLSAKIEVMSKFDDITNCKPYLVVSASMLEENVEEAMTLIVEILMNGKCDEAERLIELFNQLNYFAKQGLIEEGHMFAIQKSLSAFSKENALKEELEGENFIRWFSSFVDKFMDNAEEILVQMNQVRQKTFAQNRLFVGYSGHLSDNTIEHLIHTLPITPLASTKQIQINDNKNCAIEIPASVGYSSLGHNLYALGGKYSGTSCVLASLMSFGYLWGAIRVQGGAYGTGMNIASNGDMFAYSYRDPNLANTMAAFSAMPAVLEEILTQGMPLDDIIIGTINTTDPLLSPSEMCTVACTRYLKGITHETLTKIRKEILQTTSQSLQGLLPLLIKFVEEAKFCAVGDQASIAFLKD